ncbi:MAG: hypothetical protein LBQ02_01145 [Candidatus Nomurabacteria bacterium]|nr:hypothetical protein [Candidatus Nomurabacteria bacterium]
MKSLQSWRAHVSHANSQNYQDTIFQSICAEFFGLVVECPEHKKDFHPDCMDCYATQQDKNHIWEILKSFLTDEEE